MKLFIGGNMSGVEKIGQSSGIGQQVEVKHKVKAKPGGDITSTAVQQVRAGEVQAVAESHVAPAAQQMTEIYPTITGVGTQDKQEGEIKTALNQLASSGDLQGLNDEIIERFRGVGQ